MIPFDEHIFQMGWFTHLDNTNSFFRSITPLKIHLEPKESPTWKWKASSKPPFLGVQNVNFPRCITLAWKSKMSTYHQDAFGVARNILLEPSPWPAWLPWEHFLHDKFPWFVPVSESFFSSRSWKNHVWSSLLQIIETKNPYMFFSACYASARPVGMADFCCPAVELLKWSSQPDCCGTQHWVWLGKVLADLPNFSHLTLAGMYVTHLLPYTVDGPNPADVDNMSSDWLFWDQLSSQRFVLTGLHYVLLRGFEHHPNMGLKWWMSSTFLLWCPNEISFTKPVDDHFLVEITSWESTVKPPQGLTMSKCCETVEHFSSLGIPCSSTVDESDATKIELRSKLRFQVPR